MQGSAFRKTAQCNAVAPSGFTARTLAPLCTSCCLLEARTYLFAASAKSAADLM